MKARLPVLEDLRVASPCTEPWDGMRRGADERVRHCERCDLDVFDLSGMTRDDATALLRARAGNMCARFYRRHDGTVLTADCPAGIARLRRRLVLAAAAALSFLGFTAVAAASLGRVAGGARDDGTDLLGGSPTWNAVTSIFAAKPIATPHRPQVLMGLIAPLPPVTPPPGGGAGSGNGTGTGGTP